MGSEPMTRRASSCSVTFMVPSSAVSAPPTRPASMTAASTGPIGVTTDRLMTAPIRFCCPMALNCVTVSTAMTMPMNAPVTATTSTLFTPTSNICGNVRRRFFHRNPPNKSHDNARAAKEKKSPNATSTSTVRLPTFSTNPIAIGADHTEAHGPWQSGQDSWQRQHRCGPERGKAAGFSIVQRDVHPAVTHVEQVWKAVAVDIAQCDAVERSVGTAYISPLKCDLAGCIGYRDFRRDGLPIAEDQISAAILIQVGDGCRHVWSNAGEQCRLAFYEPMRFVQAPEHGETHLPRS